MKISIQVMIDDEHGQTQTEDIVQLDKGITKTDLVGLSLSESKAVLKKLQTVIVQQQAQIYTQA